MMEFQITIGNQLKVLALSSPEIDAGSQRNRPLQNFETILVNMQKAALLLVSLLIIGISNLYGQRGYIVKKDSVFHNVKLKDQGSVLNSLTCVLETEDGIMKYTPSQVIEYGFDNGKVYRSFLITNDNKTERVFLERISHGKIDLYIFYGKGKIRKYYVTKNDTVALTEVPDGEKKYRAWFSGFVDDCQEAVENIRYVKYSKGSLTRFISDYNMCTRNVFPRFRYGIIFGVTATKLAASDGIFKEADFKNDWGFTGGVFFDKPVGATNFSFHPEILFKQNSSSEAFREQDTEYDLVVNSSSLSIPLLLRYVSRAGRTRPFLQGGVAYSQTLKNNALLYRYTVTSSSVYTEIDDKPVLANNQAGFALGGGLLRGKTRSRLMGFEFCYFRFFPLGSSDGLLKTGELTIRTSIVF